MTVPRIDLDLLQSFEAVFTDRHVTRAARRLAISQPALSDRLRRLRVLFGDALFVREAGAMQPTPRALALAAEIAPLLVQLREVVGRQADFRPEAARRSFVLACTDYTAQVLLPPLTARLRRNAPGIDLRLTGYHKPAIAEMLARGEVDAALGVFPDPPDTAIRQTLFDETFVGVARSGHPMFAFGPLSVAAFSDLPQVMVSVNGDCRGVVDDRLAALGHSRRVALVVPYMALVPQILHDSDLIAVLPRRAARANAGALTLFDLPFETATWTVDLLWNPTTRTDRPSGWLRQQIIATARDL